MKLNNEYFPLSRFTSEVVGCANFCQQLAYLIQPFNQSVINVVDEHLHLLPETYVQKLFPDPVALPETGAIGFPDMLQIVGLPGTGDGVLCAFQANQGSSLAQIAVIQQQRLP